MNERAAVQPTADLITTLTTDEMIQLLGWQNSPLGRWLARNLFRPGVAYFARHVLRYENWIRESGWAQANRLAAGVYLRSLAVFGAEHIPRRGPVLFTCNHPGITDFMAVSAAAGRDDLSILAYTRPFLRSLPALSSHILHLTHEAGARLPAIRSVVRHLQSGNSVLMFPAGVGEPDPQVMPGAVGSLDQWQPSVGLLVRHVPRLQVVPTLVSGVLSRQALELGFVRRQTSARKKIRLAGTLQVMWQTVSGRAVADVRVDFGAPLAAQELAQLGSSDLILEPVKERMRAMIAALAELQRAYATQPGSTLPDSPRNQALP